MTKPEGVQMFKRIYYNRNSNKIQLWETVDGKTVKTEENPELIFYVHDKTKTSDITDIYENPVKSKVADSVESMKAFKDAGIKTCETDIPVEVKYLQQRYLNQELKVNMKDINICFLDIEIASPNEFPKPEEAKWPVNLVTMKFSKSNRLVTLGNKPFDEFKVDGTNFVKEYHYVPDEKELLERVIEITRKEKVDIFTGWYSDGFDYLYLHNRKENLGIKKCFSPVNDDRVTAAGAVKFGGVSILDLQTLYKKFTYSPRESYSLQAIGMFELGEGKLDYEGTINTAWRDDWHNFVNYNVQDVLLVDKLEAKTRFIELVINISYQALIPFENVFSQMSVLTGYILRFLHGQGMVLPDREHQTKGKLPGAYVMAVPGMYEKIVSFDVASMYPHMLMEYNIGPDTLIENPTEEEKKYCYSTPLSEHKTWTIAGGEKFKVGGVYYRKDKVSILSKIVKKIFDERKEMKKLMYEARDKGDTNLQTYYDRQQQIRKILINSMYGVLGNKHFHLYNIKCAMTITLSSQHLIKYLSNTTNDYFKNYFWQNEDYFPVQDEKNKLEKDPCILIDTDSNYFCFDEMFQKMGLNFKDDNEFVNWINKFNKDFLKQFFSEILNFYAEQFGVKQIIDFEKEKVITAMIILAKKKYVTKIKDDEGKIYDKPYMKVTGVEIIKTSTPSFNRKILPNIVDLIFDTKDKETVLTKLRIIKKQFRQQDISDISSPRGISEYTKYAEPMQTYLKDGLTYKSGVPMHARAAINYNYTIAKNKFTHLIPVNNGTKLKFVFVKENTNFLKQNVVAFINQYPEEFKDIFEIDFDLQFEKSFLGIIQRFFDALGWGEINLSVSKMKKLLSY